MKTPALKERQKPLQVKAHRRWWPCANFYMRTTPTAVGGLYVHLRNGLTHLQSCQSLWLPWPIRWLTYASAPRWRWVVIPICKR